MRYGFMKKLGLLVAFPILILAFVGCTQTDGNQKSVYDVLNELTKVNYASVKLNTTVTVDGESLKGEYASTAIDGGYRVDYAYEKINGFTESDGEITPPTEYKSKLIGSATVKDGKVTAQTGADCDFQIGTLSAANFKFTETNFSEVTQKDGEFSAKVKNAQAFAGSALLGSDMTVSVKYTSTALTSLTLRFVTDTGTQVEFVYTFKKTT